MPGANRFRKRRCTRIDGSTMFNSIDSSGMMPTPRRSSETKAIRSAREPAGSLSLSGRPFTVTLPAAGWIPMRPLATPTLP
ncbi:MAG: hypothetical protein FD129_1978 [bacterium]|nr:MAG: hypothetical protein FD129_1978 [bacterium]